MEKLNISKIVNELIDDLPHKYSPAALQEKIGLLKEKLGSSKEALKEAFSKMYEQLTGQEYYRKDMLLYAKDVSLEGHLGKTDITNLMRARHFMTVHYRSGGKDKKALKEALQTEKFIAEGVRQTKTYKDSITGYWHK